MELRPISDLTARLLLSRQTAGAFPLQIDDVHWHASDSQDMLGAVIPSDSDPSWRFALLRRNPSGDYSCEAAGHGYASRETARQALYDKQWELAHVA